MKMHRIQKEDKGGYVLCALFLICVGIIFILYRTDEVNLCHGAGIALTLFAVVWGLLAIIFKDRTETFILKLIFAVIFLGLGISITFWGVEITDIIFSVAALLLIVDATFKLSTAVLARRLMMPMWWIPFIISLPVIYGGFHFLAFGVGDFPTQALALGIAFLLDALSNATHVPISIAVEKQYEAQIYYGIYRRDMKSAKKRESQSGSDAEN